MTAPATTAPAARTKLDHALALAAEGFHVFPLRPKGEEYDSYGEHKVSDGKPPRHPEWQKYATRDPEKIRNWWTANPEDNIGVHCGRYGDDGKALCVVDVDAHKGKKGAATLDDLETIQGDLPRGRVVTTPTGGQHIYMVVDEPTRFGAEILGPGLDVRSGNSYVVGPGSTIDGREYVGDGVPPPAPQWLVDEIGPAPKRETASTPVTDEIDTSYAVARAIEYLETAPNVVVGAGASDGCYKTAARVKDFGISEPMCLQLLLEHWNEGNSPVLEVDDLAYRVANAYRYGTSPQGVLDPVKDFQPVNDDEIVPNPEPIRPLLKASPFVLGEPAAIPPRRWILGNLLLRRNVSLLIAQGGMGKTTLGINIALAVAADRGDVTGMPVREAGRVWVLNNEDDRDELRRRVTAAAIRFGVAPEEIAGRLYLDSGEDRRLVIARKNRDGLVMPVDRDAMIEIIRREGIDVLIVDPLIETADGVSENANEDMNRVTVFYRDVAQQANCAVLVMHHTRKLPQASSDGHAGKMDSARGASSMTGVARIVATLYGMSDKDAREHHGLAKDQKHRYVRLDEAKANMSLASPTALWFKRVGVDLGQGDQVGVLEPVALEAKAPEAKQATDLTGYPLLAFEALQEAIRRNGRSAPDHLPAAAKFARVVTLSEWRSVFVEYLSMREPGVRSSDKRSRWRDARKPLLVSRPTSRPLVSESEDFYWIEPEA